MNVHKNARLTPHGRERIVRQVESGQTLKAVGGASSKLHSANGPMPGPISAQIIVAQSFRSGCTATIGTVPMAVSVPNRPSANSV